jgi:asparagine synthetase B (glutamine-hydrolysing)
LANYKQKLDNKKIGIIIKNKTNFLIKIFSAFLRTSKLVFFYFFKTCFIILKIELYAKGVFLL